METLRRVRAILQVYEGLAERFGPEINMKRGTDPAAFQCSAEEMESVLDPLANAWRIKVLAALRRGDRSLSELGRAVELKTGHLQFHLRTLVDAEYSHARSPEASLLPDREGSTGTELHRGHGVEIRTG